MGMCASIASHVRWNMGLPRMSVCSLGTLLHVPQVVVGAEDFHCGHYDRGEIVTNPFQAGQLPGTR